MEALSPVPDLKEVTANIKKFQELSNGLKKEIETAKKILTQTSAKALSIESVVNDEKSAVKLDVAKFRRDEIQEEMDFYNSELKSLQAEASLGNSDPEAIKQMQGFIDDLKPILTDAKESVDKIKAAIDLSKSGRDLINILQGGDEASMRDVIAKAPELVTKFKAEYDAEKTIHDKLDTDLQKINKKIKVLSAKDLDPSKKADAKQIEQLSKLEKEAVKGKNNLDAAGDKLESFQNAYASVKSALKEANEFIANLTKSDEDLEKEAEAR